MAITEACKEAIWLKSYLVSSMKTYRLSQSFVIVRVPFFSQKTRYFVREQSTLMCSIILCMISLLVVILL